MDKWIGPGTIDRFSNIRFIVNPSAGNRRGDPEATIRKVLHGTGVVFEVFQTEYKGHGTELAQKAADEGVDLVVAVGGDGTINEVGRGLLGRETTLGLLPLGSGNALARALGISLNLEQACSALLQAVVRQMDVGKIGDAIFFSTAGVGLDAEVSWRFNRRPKGPRGFIPYAILTLGAFWEYKPEEVRITLEEGAQLKISPTILTIANTSQFGNGAIISPGARPDDGLLDLCIIGGTGILRTLWHIRRLFTGTIDQMPGTNFFRTRGLRIVRPGPGRFQVDGESMTGATTLDVTVVPKAIRIALPMPPN